MSDVSLALQTIFFVRHFCSNEQLTLFKQLHVLCSVLYLGNKIFALREYIMAWIFRVQLQQIFTVFLLNNLWNLWESWNFVFIRSSNIFPILVFTFLLYSGLNQVIFVFLCFLLLAVSISALYLKLFLYPDLSKESWYCITESLKIPSEDDNEESRDSTESGTCLMIDGNLCKHNKRRQSSY